MKEWLLLFFQQLRILLWKNFLVAKRSWKLSILRLLLPALFVIAFFLIFHFTTKTKPLVPVSVSSIPLCKPVISKTCVTLGYYPDTQPVRDILGLVGQFNSPSLSIGHEIMPITAYSDWQAFRYNLINDNPNTTQAGVFFDISDNGPLKYYIVYNDTSNPSSNFLDFSYNSPALLDIRLQLKIAIDRAYTRSISKEPDFDIEMSTYTFPNPWALTNTEIQSLVGQIGLAFFYLGLSTTLIIGLNAIVTEKERNIRGYLRSFGMLDGSYWLSWFIEMMTFQILSILIMMAFGYMLPGLNFFRKGNFFANFVIFLVYGIELTSLCFFLSSLVSKTRAANILGFLIYFFGLGLAIAFSFLGNIVWYLYKDSVIKVAGNWMGGLSFFPAVLFSVSVIDVQVKTVLFGSDSSDAIPPGFKWEDMTKHPGDLSYVPSVSWTLGIMLLYSIAFSLLGWYLDNIISDSFGARRHPLFPFMRTYWGFNKKVPYTHDIRKHVQFSMINQAESDIAYEQDHNDILDPNVALRVVNVSKIYGYIKHVTAVNRMNLKCSTGTVLALLGHNGAGKTSLINILTGLTSATEGDAFIYGYSATEDMDEIRGIMGVCPQFDVFWPDLTAREHLEIALCMKSKPANLQHEIDEKLNGVRLRKVANHQVQTFSGGMRRRLSVALSMVGNPKVIILDEPTTGIDPANRRYIWKLIHSIKQDKLVILTTHSMEEADRLGEKIAIMNHGILSAIGSPLHLKSKFSSGYRINFVVNIDQIDQLKNFVASTLPVAFLTAENAGSLIYVVPDGTDAGVMSNFFSTLQSGKIARDWGVSNTTLEDVFLRVTAKQV